MPAATAARLEEPQAVSSVGTLNEKHLHASLRAHYLQPGDRVEERVDGYIVDILRDAGPLDHLIIEVQTANFSAIARKMRDLVQRHRVRLVYPVPCDRWIIKLPHRRGETSTRRKSPKHPSAIDVFSELVSFPQLIAHPNFELDVVLVEEECVWQYDSPKRWRRRGWITVDRRLIAVRDVISLRCPGDYLAMISGELPDEFLTSDLAAATACRRDVAQKVAYCLRHAGVIEKVGARGNAILYAKRDAILDLAATVNSMSATKKTSYYPATIADIDRERARLRKLLRDADPRLLNRRPPNGDWSIIENVRHLLFAEQLHLGGYLQKKWKWSPFGWNDRGPAAFLNLEKAATTDIEEVLTAWDAVHRPIRAALKSASGPAAEKALWRNHRHLRTHIRIIERTLRTHTT